jgi:LPS sulfotransferase NodH
VGYAHDPIVIGHKSSTRRYIPIAESRSKLLEFHAAVGSNLRLKFLHLVRSPYDQVNARWQQKEWRRKNAPLDEIIAHVREQTEANWKMFGHCDYTEYHQVHYEDLQTQPLCTMTKVCDFLGLPLLEEHLENCRDLVYKRAEKTAATWTDDTREQVEHIIGDYPEFYERYADGT